MNAPIEISRRNFLKASALVGGGLMLGFRLGVVEHARAAEGAFDPNAWITVRADGLVTLVCPRNEMGQDVYTSLAMLLAEELGLDPRGVEIEQAAVDPVYVNKLMGAQITGGSTSVRDAWEPLRKAGAAARIMLVNAAATSWNVPAADCRVENGHVIHDAKTLTYGDLAGAASQQSVPQDIPLKPASAFEVIGKPLPRLDGADKARGRTVFGIDAKQPGMLYAALSMCPVLGGKVASFDTGNAESQPGVREVVNIGDGVAVIADHYWSAKSALADLRVNWNEDPAASIDTATLYAALERATNNPGAVIKQAGNASAVLAKGKPIEARYTSQMLAHATLEPQNCLARVSADGVDVWVSTQYPQGAHAAAASVAEVAPRQVRIHPQFRP